MGVDHPAIRAEHYTSNIELQSRLSQQLRKMESRRDFQYFPLFAKSTRGEVLTGLDVRVCDYSLQGVRYGRGNGSGVKIQGCMPGSS
jgi:hypothetical protein